MMAAHMLNCGIENHIGSTKKRRLVDIVAVGGTPLVDLAEMEHVRFVMKGGMMVKDDFAKR
jgi:imidazolonepropionase-like amidohydrolase